jgi:hypothetical protein
MKEFLIDSIKFGKISSTIITDAKIGRIYIRYNIYFDFHVLKRWLVSIKIRFEIFDETFFFKKKELICSNFFGMYPLAKKIWYLDITRINFLVGTLQGKK